MGVGRFENKHHIGILMNKKWRKKMQWTEFNSERLIWTDCCQPTKKSRYFQHSGYADHHVEKAYKVIEKFTNSRTHISLGPRIGIERLRVGPCTLNESNTRGDWIKHDAENCRAYHHAQKICPSHTKGNRQATGPRLDRQEKFEVQQRRRGERYETRGKRPQMCHGALGISCRKKGKRVPNQTQKTKAYIRDHSHHRTKTTAR